MFPECENCEYIEDCPHPTVAEDMKGTPIPPEDCPKRDKVILSKRLKNEISNDQ